MISLATNSNLGWREGEDCSPPFFHREDSRVSRRKQIHREYFLRKYYWKRHLVVVSYRTVSPSTRRSFPRKRESIPQTF
jgi:hypothetical protein